MIAGMDNATSSTEYDFTSGTVIVPGPRPTIGQAIRDAREAAGLTQAELARRISAPVAAIKRAEAGVRPYPRRLHDLAEVLSLRFTALILAPEGPARDRAPGRPRCPHAPPADTGRLAATEAP